MILRPAKGLRTLGLVLRSRYWNDASAKRAFRRFVLEIFGLDFAEWDDAGCWDDDYVPFSLFEGDTLVANVCLYLLDAVIDGEETRVAQLSAVATRPAWRRRGLNRELTRIALEWAEGKHRGVFLFSSDEAVPFYERCGFTPIEEFVEVASAEPGEPREGARLLDPANPVDFARIRDYAVRRAPVSRRFGVTNANLVMFHILNGQRENVVEVPELDCLVLCDRADDRLRIHDVLAERMPAWRDLAPHLVRPRDHMVEFRFLTDELDVSGIVPELFPGDHPFVLGEFPVVDPVFPATSRA